MRTFEISNKTSGHTLGTFTGETALDAYQAMMRDAGYRDEAHAASAGLQWSEIPADVRVFELQDIDDDDIRALFYEAGKAGDVEQFELCKRALDGDQAARRECEKVIRENDARTR